MPKPGSGPRSRTAWADTFGRSAAAKRALASLNADAGVLVTGPPGVGRSRFLAELAVDLRSGGRSVEVIRGMQSSSTLPLGAFAHLVTDARAGASEVELMAHIRRALVARSSGRLVLVVDDVHLLDGSSARVVHDLARSRTAPVVLSACDGERRPDAVDRLVDDGLVGELPLAPLEPDDARRLVRRHQPDLADRDVTDICRAAKGIPLFLEALAADRAAAGAADTGPSALSSVVLRRIGELDDDERRALEFVALAEPIELGLAERVTAPGTLGVLERRRLLVVDTEGRRQAARLAHPLYRTVLDRELSQFRRRELLRELAQQRRSFADHRRPHDVLRAVQWQLDGGDAVDDGEVVVAAHAAVALNAPVALRLAQLAWERAPDGETGTLLATALLNAGQPVELDAHCRALEPPADEGQRTNLAITWAVAVWAGLGDGDRALAILQEARTHVGPGFRDELDAIEVMIRFYTGRVGAAVTILDRLLAAPAMTDRGRLWNLLPGVLALAAAGRTGQALELGAEALALSVHLGGDVAMATTQAACVWGYAAMLHGEVDACVAALADHVHQARGRFDVVSTEILSVTHGLGLRQAGRFAEAADAFAQLNPSPDLFALAWLPFAHAWRAECLARLGRLDEARQVLDSSPSSGGPDAMHVAEREVAAAEADASAGDAAGGAARLDATVLRAEPLGQLTVALSASFRAFALDPTERRAHEVLRLAAMHDGQRAGGMAEAVEAWLRADVDGVAAVASRAEERGHGMLALDVWELVVRLSYVAGTQAQALRVRDRSAAWHAHLKITPSTPHQALTRREWEVADLAAAGHSDREISTSLGISVRTVHAHLRNVYTKLKLEGRGDLRGHPFFRRADGT